MEYGNYIFNLGVTELLNQKSEKVTFVCESFNFDDIIHI